MFTTQDLQDNLEYVAERVDEYRGWVASGHRVSTEELADWMVWQAKLEQLEELLIQDELKSGELSAWVSNKALRSRERSTDEDLSFPERKIEDGPTRHTSMLCTRSTS